jgi:hypothetical protein
MDQSQHGFESSPLILHLPSFLYCAICSIKPKIQILTCKTRQRTHCQIEFVLLQRVKGNVKNVQLHIDHLEQHVCISMFCSKKKIDEILLFDPAGHL